MSKIELKLLDKLFKVITSCETTEQLEVADRYSQLWFKRWVEKHPSEDPYEMAQHITDVISSTMSKISGEW